MDFSPSPPADSPIRSVVDAQPSRFTLTDSPTTAQRENNSPPPPPPIGDDNELINRLGQLSREISADEQSSSSSSSQPLRQLPPPRRRNRLFRESTTNPKRQRTSSSSSSNQPSTVIRPPPPPPVAIITEAQKQMRANFMARINRISTKLKRPVPVLLDAPLPDVEAVFLSINAELIERRQIAEYIRVATYAATVVEGLFRWLSRSFKPFADWDMSGLALNFRNDLEDNEDLLYAVYDKYGQYWKPNPLVSVALVLACCARDTNAKNAERKLQETVRPCTTIRPPQQQQSTTNRTVLPSHQTELDKTIAELERDMKRLTLTPPQQQQPSSPFVGVQVSPVVHRGDDGQVKRGLTLLPLAS